MKLKRFLSLALVFVMMFSIAGCNPAVTVEDLDVPTYEDAGEMMLRVDLPPNMSSREQMELYKDCGFNTIPLTEDFFSASDVEPYIKAMEVYEQKLKEFNDGIIEDEPTEPTKPKYIEALELCEELGIDVLIRPHSSYVEWYPDGHIGEPNYFEQFFSNFDFRDYPAVKGFMLVDEPSWGKVTDLANRYLDWFNNEYGGDRDGDGAIDYEVFVNHLGPGSTAWKDNYSKTKTYDEFINHYNDNFLSKLNSANKTLSYDGYYLRNDGVSNYVSSGWLLGNLKMRNYADKFGIDFGAYIQCFTGYSDLRDLTSYADFSFQVYNYLAFGAKRLSYYGYRDFPPESHLMEGGEPRQKWYWVQEVNELIKKIDGIIYNFDFEGLYTSVGTGSFFETNEAFDLVRNEVGYIKSLNDVKAFTSKYDTFTTQFKDKDGRKAFMLVNYEEPSVDHTNKVEMKFENADGILYYRNGERFVEVLKEKTFTVDLKPGEGIFMMPLYKK